MSEQFPDVGRPPASSAQVRTLAVRLPDDLRAQLDVIAQLNNRSVTEEIRFALESWVSTSKSDPKVLQRAETVRREIEREAETKRNAIEAIFGGTEKDKPTSSQKPSRPSAKQDEAAVSA